LAGFQVILIGLSIPKMLSGANGIEISDIQEGEVAWRFPTNQHVTMYIA
jgi:hypothetical protein